VSGMANSAEDPEIGRAVRLDDATVNVLEAGSGSPVLLIHGSGPGVTAFANWRLVIPRLQDNHRMIAPDMLGFGYTEADDVRFDLERWVSQCVQLLDELGLQRVAVVGNSFGGAVGLRLALDHPERVERLVLMGASATPFPITDGLEAVWGYQPSRESMGHLLREVFVYDGSTITDDLIDMRYQASVRPGFHERFSALFPTPRQQWVDAMSPYPDELKAMRIATMLIHGRDDKVIPADSSRQLAEQIPGARLEIIPECGHWVQIEKTDEFVGLLRDFLENEQS
jgi:2-hydroxymuconate-semialdehyde hydrolase